MQVRGPVDLQGDAMTNSKERQALQCQARAKRVAQLREMGLSVKETASEVGCDRAQVRPLQLLGQRLLSLNEERP